MRQATTKVTIRAEERTIKIEEWTRARKLEIISKVGLDQIITEASVIENKLDRARTPQQYEILLKKVAEYATQTVKAKNEYDLMKVSQCVVDPHMTMEELAKLPDSEFNALLLAVEAVLDQIPDRLSYLQSIVLQEFRADKSYTGEEIQQVLAECMEKAFREDSLKNS